MALLHLILWLIHAVVAALASALVDVFTHLIAAVIALLAAAAVIAIVMTTFGLGGLGLARRRRRP